MNKPSSVLLWKSIIDTTQEMMFRFCRKHENDIICVSCNFHQHTDPQIPLKYNWDIDAPFSCLLDTCTKITEQQRLIGPNRAHLYCVRIFLHSTKTFASNIQYLNKIMSSKKFCFNNLNYILKYSMKYSMQ